MLVVVQLWSLLGHKGSGKPHIVAEGSVRYFASLPFGAHTLEVEVGTGMVEEDLVGDLCIRYYTPAGLGHEWGCCIDSFGARMRTGQLIELGPGRLELRVVCWPPQPVVAAEL